MKYFVLISCIWAALGLVACGGGDSSETTDPTARPEPQQSTTASEIAGSSVRPKIHVPPGPPPKNLVVRVLRRGSGTRRARSGQRLNVQYVGVNYRTGRTFEVRWGKSGPFSFTLGIGEVRKGWDIGLKGMRVGGRRELILPSRLAYGTGALIYVVELLGIESARRVGDRLSS